MSKKASGKTDFDSDLILIRTAVGAMISLRSRTGLYGYLKAVYRVYRRWRKEGSAKRNARLLSRQIKSTFRANTSPIRILIAATLPNADPKQMSRWTRALQFADSEKTLPKDLLRVFEENSGIVGCAKLSARFDPKRDTGRSDWGDEC